MPCDALPYHLRVNPYPKGDGTDHDNKAQQYWSRCWTSFGFRANPQRWTWARQGLPFLKWSLPVCPLLARWREVPVLILGYNVTRWLNNLDAMEFYDYNFSRKLYFIGREKLNKNLKPMDATGPSPIQYHSKWGFALTWPLHFAFWYQSSSRIGAHDNTVLFFRIGARWDSGDGYFGFPDLFLGLQWN